MSETDLLWVVQRSCGGKHRYSRETAVSVAKKVPNIGSRRARAYHCPFCNSWHVGHGQAASKVRRRKKFADRSRLYRTAA